MNGKPKYKTEEERQAARRASKQRYMENHPEKKAEYLARLRAWGKLHPERLRLRQTIWRLRNRELINSRERPRSVAKNWSVRLAMIAAYGPLCACCGEAEPAFLTLDHVNGDGAVHRRTFAGVNAARAQHKIIEQLRKQGWPNENGRFRILCWNCQWGTQRREGCPHHRVAISA